MGSGGANSLDTLNQMWTPELGQSALDGTSASKIIREAEEKRLNLWRASQRVEIAKVWSECDQDGNGFLDSDELVAVLSKMGHRKINVAVVMAAIDEDGDGEIDEEEFFEWWCTRSEADRERLKGAPPRGERTEKLLAKLKIAARLSGALQHSSARRNTVGFAQIAQSMKLRSNGEGMTPATAKKFEGLRRKCQDLEAVVLQKTGQATASHETLCRLQESLESRLAAAATQHTNLLHEHALECNCIRTEHAQMISELSEKHARALERVEREHASIENSSQAEAAHILSVATAAHQAELRDARGSCEAAAFAKDDESSSLHASTLKSVKNDCAQRIRKMQSECSVKLEDMSLEYTAQLAAVVRHHDSMLKSMSDNALSRTRAFDEMRAVHASALATAHSRHQDANANAEFSRQRLIAEHAAEMSLQHKRSSLRLADTVSHHESAMVALVTTHEKISTRWTKEKDSECTALHERLIFQHQQNLEGQEEQNTVMWAQQQAKFLATATLHEATLSATVKKHEETVRYLASSHASEISTLKDTCRSLNAKLADLGSRSDLQATEHSNSCSALAAHHTRLTASAVSTAVERRSAQALHELRTVQAAHTQDIESLAEAHYGALEQLRAEHEHALIHVARARAEQHNVHMTEIQNLRSTMGSQSHAAAQAMADAQAMAVEDVAAVAAKLEASETVNARLQQELHDRHELCNMLTHKLQRVEMEMDVRMEDRVQESQSALLVLEAQKRETDKELIALKREVDLNFLRVSRSQHRGNK